MSLVLNRAEKLVSAVGLVVTIFIAGLTVGSTAAKGVQLPERVSAIEHRIARNDSVISRIDFRTRVALDSVAGWQRRFQCWILLDYEGKDPRSCFLPSYPP